LRSSTADVQISQAGDLFVQFHHAIGNLFQTLHARLQTLSSQAQFFQQSHAATTAFRHALLNLLCARG
jgi:hypothetical protein